MPECRAGRSAQPLVVITGESEAVHLQQDSGEVPERDSVIPPEVIQAYRSAEYVVSAEGGEITLRIGIPCPAIASLVEQSGAQGAVCITAFNPLGEQLDEASNEAAARDLEAALEKTAWGILDSRGEDPHGGWEPEAGYLAFGLTRAAAVQLGHRFRQNALVWVGSSGIPELVLLR